MIGYILSFIAGVLFYAFAAFTLGPVISVTKLIFSERGFWAYLMGGIAAVGALFAAAKWFGLLPAISWYWLAVPVGLLVGLYGALIWMLRHIDVG